MLGGALALAPSAFAQTDQPIYTDSLVAGWQTWSWATVNLANTTPIHSGIRSASVNADAWEAIYLHHDAFDTSGYSNLVFWIHGGAYISDSASREVYKGEVLAANADAVVITINYRIDIFGFLYLGTDEAPGICTRCLHPMFHNPSYNL